jgi:hypothetical protein
MFQAGGIVPVATGETPIEARWLQQAEAPAWSDGVAAWRRGGVVAKGQATKMVNRCAGR